jgi:transcriptional regulator with XRE-family HTH domain
MPTFGELLKADREKLGLSQDALAKMLEVSQQAVANWEKDTSMPKRDRRTRLLQILGPTSQIAMAPPRVEFVDTHNPTISPLRAQRIERAFLGDVPPELAVESAKRFEETQAKVQRLMDQIKKDDEELRDALPDWLHRYLKGKVAVGAMSRQLDYLSPRLGVEVKRAPDSRFRLDSHFSHSLMRLAIVRNITQVTQIKREYLLLIVTGDMPLASLALQRVMFDAGVLGITLHQVPSYTAAGHLIAQIEAEPLDEINASLEATLNEIALDATLSMNAVAQGTLNDDSDDPPA